MKFALAQIPFTAHVLVAVPTEERQIDVSQRVNRNSASMKITFIADMISLSSIVLRTL